MAKRRIGILGATGHIAKGLVYYLAQSDENELFLFSRSPENVQHFLEMNQIRSPRIHISRFNGFGEIKPDAIINCIGPTGNPANSSVFSMMEGYDNVIMEYLISHGNTLYINFSSGAAYGYEFREPVSMGTQSTWDINGLKSGTFYGISKLYSEAKHRAHSDLNIIDLRVFSYFSRFIREETQFLLNEIMHCIRDNRCFYTTRENVVRDFVGPEDLACLVNCCLEQKHLNGVYDVFSVQPATKYEIIDFFKNAFGLCCEFNDSLDVSSVTGAKNQYYSTNHKALELGYSPKFTSLEVIESESAFLLNHGHR